MLWSLNQLFVDMLLLSQSFENLVPFNYVYPSGFITSEKVHNS